MVNTKPRRRTPAPNPDISSVFQTFGCQAKALHTALSEVLDETDFRDRHLLHSFLSKLGNGEVTDEGRRRAAVRGWYEDEELNAKTEKRLRAALDSNYLIHGIPVRSILGVAASLIADLLPPFEHRFYEHARFTNGAAVGYRRDTGDPVYKYDGIVTTTPLAYTRVRAIIYATPLWRRHLEERFGSVEAALKVVPGETGFTVRKNAETDRYCSRQATGNMCGQTAIGWIIRDHLKRVGIDLDDQSRNRKAAYQASITGSDATIDLRSASNCVVSLLCALLLPLDWWREVEAFRSPLCQPGPGEPWKKTVMVGAMGNGFTFELETLVFWALAKSCLIHARSRGKVLVYGDDIIVPTSSVHLVMAVLGFCGFRVNHEKSFWSGHFRESCGGHYYHGLDVTPLYARKPINDTTRMLWFLNSLRRWSNIGGRMDPRVVPLYKRLVRKYVSPRLWGGNRSSSVTSLWTTHKPRERLVYRIRQREINGVPALLRTFQYMSPSCEASLRRAAKFHGDIQAFYEVFGDVPISASMSRLTTVTETPVGIKTNCELWFDDCPESE